MNRTAFSSSSPRYFGAKFSLKVRVQKSSRFRSFLMMTACLVASGKCFRNKWLLPSSWWLSSAQYVPRQKLFFTIETFCYFFRTTGEIGTFGTDCSSFFLPFLFFTTSSLLLCCKHDIFQSLLPPSRRTRLVPLSLLFLVVVATSFLLN